MLNKSPLYPSFSIIIELENIVLSEMWRTRQMIEELSKQIIESNTSFQSKPEVIIVFNSLHVKTSEVNDIVNKLFSPCKSYIELKIISKPNGKYFEVKNFGAENSKNDIIIFLDSDVIPDNDWLVGMLEPFNDPQISIVGGNPYISTNSLLEKAFALFWFFPPLPDINQGITESDNFFSNNVAFKREVFMNNKFPESNQFRGQGGLLIPQLKNKNIKIFNQSKSRVSHPTTNGIKHFILRAWIKGHNKVVSKKQTNFGNTNSIVYKSVSYRQSLPNLIRQMLERNRILKLNPFELIGCFAISFTYYGIVLISILYTTSLYHLFRKYRPVKN